MRVEGFDVDLLRADVDQLWAEAATREAAGEAIRLEPSLWAAAEEEQDERRVEDPFTSALASAIGEQNGKISGAAVWDLLRIPVGQRTQDHNMRLGDAMRELHFERKKLRFGGPAEWGYARGTEDERRQLMVFDDGRREGVAGRTVLIGVPPSCPGRNGGGGMPLAQGFCRFLVAVPPVPPVPPISIELQSKSPSAALPALPSLYSLQKGENGGERPREWRRVWAFAFPLVGNEGGNEGATPRTEHPPNRPLRSTLARGRARAGRSLSSPRPRCEP